MKTAREPASVPPFLLGYYKSASGILCVRRSRLDLVGTRLAVAVDQPSFQTSRFSPLLIVHNGSELTWFDSNNCATIYPHL